MTLALALGILFGLSAVVAWRLLFPPPPPLSAAVDRLQRRNALAGITPLDEVGAGGSSSALDRLAESLGQMLIGLGLNFERLEPDLRLMDRTAHQHMAKKVLMAFYGFALPQMYTAITFVSGSPTDLAMPAAASVGLGILFFFVPDSALRSEAEERREAFRHSLGSFLDLVVISLAGGAGVESALRDASSIGNSWAFVRLRRALEGAALTGQTPWVALTSLGEELAIPELVELSASVSLAGTEGARVRDSLATKAASIRDHALADVETEAQSSTERMVLPMVMIFIGFLVLVGYPSLSLLIGN